MICLICRQAEIVNGQTSVVFERGEMRFVVNNVPALVCLSCGEAYVVVDVAVRLLQSAGEISESGMSEMTINYQSPP